MLDHIQAGRILEQPAGKNLAPGQRLIGAGPFLDEHLHKGANFARALPGHTALTTGELDRDVADPLGLASFQDHVLRQVVAFVEQAERRDPILDRGAIFALDHFARNALAGRFLGHFSGLGVSSAAALAGSQSQRGQQQERESTHQASGDHAS
jgi:hypothetical protein